MSRAPSSRGGTRRAHGFALALAGLVLAGCTHAGGNGGGSGAIGFVRMGELVKSDPMYAQLSKFDQDIAAPQLKSVGGEKIARSGADVQRETAELQRQLTDAANRAQTELKAKQVEYQQRESDAVKAILGASGGLSAASAGVIADQMRSTASQQAQSVNQEAQSNLNAFRQQTISQDKAAVSELSRSLDERANRTYRARAEELREREASYALSEANADAAQRLSLRTKLSNLPLDDAARKDITDQLDALDRKEADGLAAMRNRDQVTLAELQTQLGNQTKTDFAKQSQAIHSRTTAKLADRTGQTQSNIVAQTSGNVGSVTATAPNAVRLTSATRDQLQALHKKYQTDFQKDADQTVKSFLRTKEDLSRRYAELHGADAGAQAGVQKQIDNLQRQRADLYDQIVAQIGREVKLVAQKRSITVVVSDVVAPVGVDLTDDTEKDLESLHE
jgi:hypothetical protein